ncbi:AMP-binding protein [Pseudomonas sp. 5Ae-yellow]|uniref:AMP-binding protein n=1 Tax=Pseudomonas sp. 5Ae-yellow TaxID=2759848 RepID=UPI0015F61703|nr:AMP-binding protein [Pseudomonas sp. 5Ae-yellow]MBA6421341.1 AMP-binding protein [Pseudomonas sp. 5Ae-yellow]|tara:strand:- start:5795 stop:7474 length:1680 start_codon:yes stop_codon:yes gene_type:complete
MSALTKAPATALEAFLRQESLQADRIYLIQPMPNGEVVELSWREVGDQARRMASHLKSLSFAPGSQIGLLSKNCAHWIIADLAIWMAGHVSVPLYPTQTADSTRQVLEHSDTCAVFIGKLDDWQNIRGGVPLDMPWIGLPLAPDDDNITPWQLLQDRNAALEAIATPTEDQLATIVYTSGTTGMPKGVMLSFGSMYLSANNGLRLFNISAEDRLLSYLPMSHVAERQFIEIASLLSGQQVYFVNSVATFFDDVRRARPTVFFAAPRIWEHIKNYAQQRNASVWSRLQMRLPVLSAGKSRRTLADLGLDQVRYAVCGAARINAGLVAWFAERGMQIVEAYGMTENCGYSHLGRPKKIKSGYIGLPNPGVECRLSAEGEVLVRSRALMLGYYKDPQRTAEVVDDEGFLHTGDLGEIDQDGFLRLTGRTKDIFKTSKGRYVTPVPIETLLLDHPLIADACVVGHDLPQPLALIRLRATADSHELLNRQLDTLLQGMNATLQRSDRLACLVVVSEEWTAEEGFRTANHKLKRNVVEATYQGQLQHWLVSGNTVVWQQDDKETA